MECKAFGTLATVVHVTETYTVPRILQAYDSGVKIWLGEVLYTRETFNPFENYMDIFKGAKNDADAIKDHLEGLDNLTPEQEDELKNVAVCQDSRKADAQWLAWAHEHGNRPKATCAYKRPRRCRESRFQS